MSEKADLIDTLQYVIFKWVLFVFFIVYLYRLADSKIHLTQALLGVTKALVQLMSTFLVEIQRILDAVRSRPYL